MILPDHTNCLEDKLVVWDEHGFKILQWFYSQTLKTETNIAWKANSRPIEFYPWFWRSVDSPWNHEQISNITATCDDPYENVIT